MTEEQYVSLHLTGFRWVNFFLLLSHVVTWEVDQHGGLPGGSDGKESTCHVETWVLSLGWEDTLKEGMATHCSILA